MSLVNVNAIEPSTGTDIVLGASGDTTTVPSGATLTVSGTMNASSITAGTLAEARGGTGTTSYTPGITEADQWRITTSFQNTANPIASNWERNDTEFEKIGTGMTESSGVFTFPSTGKWNVSISSNHYIDSSTDRATGADLELSVNAGGAWSTINNHQGNGYDSGNSTAWSTHSANIIDITNTTNYLVRMSVIVNNTATWTDGSSTRQKTGMTFIKLGET